MLGSVTINYFLPLLKLHRNGFILCLASSIQGYTYELYLFLMDSGNSFIFIVAFHCINVAKNASHFSVVHLGCFRGLIIMNKIMMNDIGQSFEGINKISCVDTEE